MGRTDAICFVYDELSSLVESLRCPKERKADQEAHQSENCRFQAANSFMSSFRISPHAIQSNTPADFDKNHQAEEQPDNEHY
jgi:hypothetical protein